jgi:hypothetical protein
MALVLEIPERRLTRVDDQVNRSASPAVAAVGAAARNVRLVPKGGCAVAAVAGAQKDADAIEEHRAYGRMPRGRAPQGRSPSASPPIRSS